MWYKVENMWFDSLREARAYARKLDKDGGWVRGTTLVWNTHLQKYVWAGSLAGRGLRAPSVNKHRCKIPENTPNFENFWNFMLNFCAYLASDSCQIGGFFFGKNLKVNIMSISNIRALLTKRFGKGNFSVKSDGAICVKSKVKNSNVDCWQVFAYTSDQSKLHSLR